MMDLLIKGMEMPTSCEKCKTMFGCCDYSEDGTIWCRLARGYVGDERTVCPIIPVPPHGKLGDLDVICKECEKDSYGYNGISPDCIYCAIHLIPIIIPASKEKTE